MKRKTKEKRKKLAKRVVYFVVVIAFVILIVLILRKPDEFIINDEVIIEKLKFEDIGEDVYIKFDIKNPTNEQKTCLLNITFADKKYKGYLDISAKSKKYYKVLVDMPYGKTDVRVDYICS